MAEKEERIYISKHGEDNPCDTCEDTSGEECDFCMENYEWNASVARTEAVDKISRALFKHEAPSHLVYDNMPEGYLATFKKRAEIALETILEK